MSSLLRPPKTIHWRHAMPILVHPYRGYRRLHSRFGPTVAIERLGRKPIILTMDEDLVATLFMSHSENLVRPESVVSGIFRANLGEGIVSAEGTRWEERRRRGGQRIHGAILEEDQVEFLRESLRELRDDVRALAVGGVVDLLPLIERFTLSVSIRLFSGDAVARGNGFEEIYAAVRTASSGTQKIADIRWQMCTALPRPVRFRDNSRRRALAPSFNRLAALAPNPEVRELLMATYENPSSALSWSTELLGENPEALMRIRAEAANVDLIDTPGLNVSDLDGLRFTGAVIQEALRLYPPIAYLGRRVSKDIDIGDLHIDSGSNLAVVPYCLHRNPDRWDAPDQFRPERFLDDGHSSKGIPRLWSFGAGPRGCPGSRLAMQISVAALAVIASEVWWTAPSGQQLAEPTGRYPWSEKAPGRQQLVAEPAVA